MIVPFFGDQQFWGSMIGEAGAGAKPVPYKSLTAEKLAEGISRCWGEIPFLFNSLMIFSQDNGLKLLKQSELGIC
jgi:hypothetical protein